MRRNLFSFICLVLSTSSFATAPLPVEAYASLPEIRNVSISPDGSNIAAIINIEKKGVQNTAVSILDLSTGSEKIPIVSDNKKFIIQSLRWANDDLLLISSTYPESIRGIKVSESRLLKYNLKTSKINYVLNKQFFKRLNYIPQFQSNILDILPDEKDYILMSIAGHEINQEPSVVRVSLAKGKTSYIQPSQRYVRRWLTDQQHRVRIGTYQKDDQYIIYEVPLDSKKMRQLWTFKAFSKNKVIPLGFGTDPNQLYVRAFLGDDMALFRVNLQSDDLEKELVADNIYDIKKSLLNSNLDDRYTGWDKEYIQIVNSLDTALPDKDNHILNFSADKQRYIAYSSNSESPGIYLLGDRSNNSLSLISEQYPLLKEDFLFTKKLISYKARDGLLINGRLTLPTNPEKKKLPTIIFPHGGPISFDGDGFDYWAQFFASRGYAVLQMDFRGSSGYGYDFMMKGIKGWGLAMQDDVEDATRWIINENITDPEKICIVGASYGGYAALMATIKTPDLYKCAISFAGVTDLEYLLRKSRNFSNHEIVKEQIGYDREQLANTSPINFVKKINTPILLIHGNKDRVVNIRHSEKMYNELKSEGKEVNYIELENGDHHLNKNANRIKTFKTMESFLEKYLK